MDDILLEQQQRFVHTDPITGLTKDDAEKAIADTNKSNSIPYLTKIFFPPTMFTPLCGVPRYWPCKL